MSHRAALRQSWLLVHVWRSRAGDEAHAQHPLVVGIAQQFGLPKHVTMVGPHSLVGVLQADAP